MADDVDVRRGILHDAIDVVSLLWQPNGIHLAAHATDFAAVLPTVGVRVRPVNRGVARPLRVRGIGVGNDIAKIIVIASGGGDGKSFRVPVVCVVRAFFETEMRRRVIVPKPARGLVAEILRLNQRRAVAALDAVGAEHISGVLQRVRARILADHHAVIFGNRGQGGVGGGVGVAARAHDAPAVRIQFFSQRHHLPHVVRSDNGVAGLPKQDARTVAKINH